MDLLRCLSFLFLIYFVQGQKKVNLDVYYEAHCPHSKAFIIKHLYPTLITDGLIEYVDLKMNPYGRATDDPKTPGNFICLHGNEECIAAKYHACALNWLAPSESLEYVNCFISEDKINAENKIAKKVVTDEQKEEGIKKCSEEILQCGKSSNGTDYFAEFGKDVKKLPVVSNPSTTGIPYYEFNKKPKKVDWKNFKNELCASFDDPPPKCRTDLDVYYEAHCPDSQKFVIHYLYPAMIKSNILRKFNLKLNPYGLATNKSTDSKLDFKCRHGQVECEAAKYHSCAIEKLHIDQSLEYITCLMRSWKKTDFKKCNNGDVIKADIENCAKTDGYKFFSKFGKLTPVSKFSGVPHIIFEKKYDFTAYTNFFKELEKYVPKNEIPVFASSVKLCSSIFTSLLLAISLKIFA